MISTFYVVSDFQNNPQKSEQNKADSVLYFPFPWRSGKEQSHLLSSHDLAGDLADLDPLSQDHFRFGHYPPPPIWISESILTFGSNAQAEMDPGVPR